MRKVGGLIIGVPEEIEVQFGVDEDVHLDRCFRGLYCCPENHYWGAEPVSPRKTTKPKNARRYRTARWLTTNVCHLAAATFVDHALVRVCVKAVLN